MDFGLLFPFRNAPGSDLPFSELYKKHLDLVVEAEELGYDTIWLTEHHFVEDGYSPSLLPIAAAIAARTKKIRIGTFLILLPLHNPLRVAEDAATVDVISNGRFDLGIGQGYRVPEFTGFNVPRNERGARLEEGADIIRRAWTEKNLTYEGKFNRFVNVTVIPGPVQKPHPPIWIGARGPKALARAARNGYHLMGTGPTEHQAIYDNALRENGKNPTDFHIAQLRTVFVHASAEKAWDASEAGIHHMLSCYGRWFIEANDLPGDSAYGADIPSVGQLRHTDTTKLFGEALIVGTPDTAIKLIEDYEARNRFSHLVMATALPGVEPRKVRDCLTLFAKEVIPHFRRKARGPR